MPKKLPEITPSEFKRILKILEKLPNPPAIMIYGVPGIGKTQIIKKDVFADTNNYEVRVKYLSRMDPSDWSGMPEVVSDENEKVTEFVKIKLFSKPKNGRRLVIFFDELNTAMPQVLNSALDIILEKKNDNTELPENTIIVAAGNLGEDDGTYVEELSSAVKTRLVQFVLKPDLNDWLNWAKKSNINSHIINFIKKKGIDYLIDINGFKNGDDQITTPRGWERVSEFMKTVDIKNENTLFLKVCQGILGQKIGKEFCNFVISNINEENNTNLEEKWRIRILKLSRVLNDEESYKTPQNISEYVVVVDEGLKNNYNGAKVQAEKLTAYLVKHNLPQTYFNPLKGKDISSYISYLESVRNSIVGVSSIIDKLRAEVL